MKLLHEWLYEEMHRADKQRDDLEEQLLAGDLSRLEEYVNELQKVFSLLTLLKVAVNLHVGYTAEAAITDAAQFVLEADHEEA